VANELRRRGVDVIISAAVEASGNSPHEPASIFEPLAQRTRHRLGMLAQLLQTLRYYERRLPLAVPTRRASGQRA
jgi:hypothetical protein